MAASSYGALKAFLESQGLGIAAYRDGDVPPDTPRPYVSIAEQLIVVPDGVSTAYHRGVRETAQVNVWQDRLNRATGARTETFILPRAVVAALDGAVLRSHPQHVYGCRLVSVVRLPGDDTNVIHHAITIELFRDL